MEEQPSKSKLYVAIFAICVIVAGIFAMFGIALGTTRDVLNGYTQCGESVYRSFENADRNVQSQYATFFQNATDTVSIAKAQQLQQLTEELVTQIQKLRYDVITFSCGESGLNVDNGNPAVMHIAARDITAKDNFDQPTYYLLIDKSDKAPRATILKTAIDQYKKAVVELLPAESQSAAEAEIGFLNTNDDGTASWEVRNFDHALLCSVATTLDAFTCDVKNAEFIVLSYLSK